MKEELSMGKLRLFFLTAFLLLMTLAYSIRAYAADKLIRIYADSGTIRQEVNGEKLFEKALMPGASETAVLSVENELDKPVYYDLRCTSAAKNDLFNALKLYIENDDGEKIYQGNLKNLNVLIGPQKSKQNEKLILKLELPKEAGNETAGKKADFSLLITFKSEATSKGDGGADGGSSGGSSSGEAGGSTSGGSGSGGDNSGSSSSGQGGNQGGDKANSGSESSQGNGTSGSNAGGSSGGNGTNSGGSGSSGSSSSGSGHGSGSGGSQSTGLSGVAAGSSSGSSGSGTKTNGSVSETGNIISGSKYERDFSFDKDGALITTGTDGKTNLNRKGIFINTGATGGDEEKTYSFIDASLKKGINTGSWKKDKNGFWQYILSDGSVLKNGFSLIKNPNADGADEYCWYYFDAEGRLMIGWIRTDEYTWYHSHEENDKYLGAIESGWITGSEDKALYYTSEIDARMKTGWIGFKTSDGKSIEYYYFAKLSDTYRQNWFFNTGIGRWIYDKLGYRSYGSMYKSEMTPDGCSVGSDGRWTS